MKMEDWIPTGNRKLRFFDILKLGDRHRKIPPVRPE